MRPTALPAASLSSLKLAAFSVTLSGWEEHPTVKKVSQQQLPFFMTLSESDLQEVSR